MAVGVALVVGQLVGAVANAVNNYKQQENLRRDARMEAENISKDIAALQEYNMNIPVQRAEALDRLAAVMNSAKGEVKNVILGTVKRTQDVLGTQFNDAINQTIQQATQQGLGGSQAQQEAARKTLGQLSEQQLQAGEQGQQQIAQALGQIDLQQAERENDIMSKFNEINNASDLELLKLGSAQRRYEQQAGRPTDWWNVFLGGNNGGVIGSLAGSGAEAITNKFFPAE